MSKNSGEIQYQADLRQLVTGQNCTLSDLIEDVKFLEQCGKKGKKKESRFMKGVSISEQKKRVDNVLKAGKMIISIGGKVKKALVAKEKRIWGDVHWMTEDDKKQADLVWAERHEKKTKKEAKKDEE